MILAGNGKGSLVSKRALNGGLRFGKPLLPKSQYKILASLCVIGDTVKLRGHPVLIVGIYKYHY
jgi:hypothetical protein